MSISSCKVIRIIFCLLAALTVTGCVSRSISDLEQYAQDVLARPGGRIEPIPEIVPYEPYEYQSAKKDARSPFELFYQKKEEVAEAEESGLTPEMEQEIKTRHREELEQFELDSLRMVGTLQDSDEMWGIIQDPDGVVHRVREGNYMGRNIGKILNIYEERIVLREIFKNSQGRWEERQAAIALAEE